MKVLACFSHGNGPLARCLDFLSSYYGSRGSDNEDLEIYLPLNRVSISLQRILKGFEDILNLRNGQKISIFLLPELWSILNQLPSLGVVDYNNYLEMQLSILPNIQQGINNLVFRPLQVISYDTHMESSVTWDKIDFAITRELPFTLPIMTYELGFGPQSEILTDYKRSVSLNVELNLSFLIDMYKEAESSRTISFLSIPSSIYSIETKCENLKDARYRLIPPIISKKTHCNQRLTGSLFSFESGLSAYVYISGTGIIEQRIIDKLALLSRQWQISFHSNNSSLLGFGGYWDPHDLAALSPTFIIARVGWGITWTALFSQIPLIALPITVLDDPEITCNTKRLIESKLALPLSILETFNRSRLFEYLAENIDAQHRTFNILLDRFGTIYGQDVATTMLDSYS